MKLKDQELRHINLIKEILNIIPQNYILKGGTTLLLDYNLDRFSEDIDLDYTITNRKHATLSKTLVNFYIKNKFDYTIKKDTDNVFRIMIDYGNRKLKIEASSRDLISPNTYNKSLNGNYNVYNLKTLGKKKLNAFLKRNKFRDLYDIHFLLQAKAFNNDDIIQIYKRFNEKGEKMYEYEYKDDEILQEKVDFDDFIVDFYNNINDKVKDIERYENTI